MESKQQGIFRLLIIMIFFCLSIILLNKKKDFSTETNIDMFNVKIDHCAHFSIDHIYQEISTLFSCHNLNGVISFLTQFKQSFIYDLVEKMIMDQQSFLNSSEKITIVYAMVAHCNNKKNMQYDLLDLVLNDCIVNENSPLLYILAKSKYADLIPVFIAWGKDKQKNDHYKGLLALHAERAFTVAVYENDCDAVELLLSKKIRITKPIASCLLWNIIEHNKNPKLLSLLIRHAQADVNSTHNGKTLLVAAVEKNDIESVRILLEHGAVVDRIDRDNTTALKLAIEHKYHTLAQLLKEYGA